MTSPLTRRTLLSAAAVLAAPRVRAGQPPRVMATFSILGDLVRQVAGERAVVRVLAGPEADVHEFEPTPAHAQAIAAADVLVSNGLGLETWLPRLAAAAGFKGRAVVASRGVKPRRLGHETDPHAWQFVGNAKLYVAAIRDGLAAADPEGAAGYAAAAGALLGRLDAIDAEIRAGLAPIPRARRIIVTTHDAFGYYGAAYGVDFLAPLGLSTDAEPSAKEMAALVRQIRARHVRALFLERLGNNTLINQVAQETGVRVGDEVYSDALSPPDGPAATYETMMRHNLAAFVKALA